MLARSVEAVIRYKPVNRVALIASAAGKELSRTSADEGARAQRGTPKQSDVEAWLSRSMSNTL
jgi:hypothetical protein